jgi:hypothetical protein
MPCLAKSTWAPHLNSLLSQDLIRRIPGIPSSPVTHLSPHTQWNHRELTTEKLTTGLPIVTILASA